MNEELSKQPAATPAAGIPDLFSPERSETRLVAEAALFAAQAHGFQTREDTGDSYLVHLAEVAAMVASIEPYDAVLHAAAWLHDTVEETAVTEEIIRERFGDEVANLVVDVTDPEGLKGKERRQRQVDHTAQCGERVKQLKIADKTSNTEEYLNLPEKRFDTKDAARYLKWAKRVVDVSRGTAPQLEERFDRSAKRLQAMIDAHDDD
ncbi:HD domain-containing protein [Notoacmeibacter ruber]|uniref:Bifunctional (P)ppGpp synthetase/guanosine-3',5'-bis(Diphosphate) 3'-pyrophosphohydrolase n=1 Tax=Notoacmeibacter ruber TaxID=2670375 RepID=A0A3L7JFN8_9HYPH|nr:HD domain-containing protein [Notoacmeibacter ruber]RLQ88411.1 bifunctional (p)ppGpp synthetase/guanosine-3',5'-bis(diphosphate) 3'-pyrophosphohydrolase [Notoacmeibacter ruber]